MNSLLSSRLFDNNDFYAAFKYDLANARRSIIIESPFITTKRMDSLLPALGLLKQRGIEVVINTRSSPSEHDSEFSLQAMRAVRALQKRDVDVLYTARLHRKLAVIDGEILWEGRLNILSHSDSCEIMRRTISRQLANEMLDFIEIKSRLH